MSAPKLPKPVRAGRATSGRHIRVEVVAGEGKEIALVNGGQDAYLWIGDQDGKFFTSVHGPEKLLALAKAILAEIRPLPKKRRKASKKGKR